MVPPPWSPRAFYRLSASHMPHVPASATHGVTDERPVRQSILVQQTVLRREELTGAVCVLRCDLMGACPIISWLSTGAGPRPALYASHPLPFTSILKDIGSNRIPLSLSVSHSFSLAFSLPLFDGVTKGNRGILDKIATTTQPTPLHRDPPLENRLRK